MLLEQEKKDLEMRQQQRGGGSRQQARRLRNTVSQRSLDRIVTWKADMVADWLVGVLQLEGVLMASIQKVFIEAGVGGMQLINMSYIDMIQMGIQVDYALAIEAATEVELEACLVFRGVEAAFLYSMLEIEQEQTGAGGKEEDLPSFCGQGGNGVDGGHGGGYDGQAASSNDGSDESAADNDDREASRNDDDREASLQHLLCDREASLTRRDRVWADPSCP